MKTTILPLRLLAAVYAFQAVKDVRYYLNGTMIEPRTNGGVRAIATDGHTLAIATDDGGSAVERIILPSDAVAWALKQKGEHVFLDYDDASGAGTIRAESGAVIPVTLIDGVFPDYQAVIPMMGDDLKPLGAVNADYLARFSLAAKAVKKAGHGNRYGFGVTLWGNEVNRSVLATVQTHTPGLELAAVLMPLRDSVVLVSAVSGMLA